MSGRNKAPPWPAEIGAVLAALRGIIVPSLMGQRVKARYRIEQHPRDRAPTVPRGRAGEIVDDLLDVDGLLVVDFGGRYGPVLVYPEEVRLA